MKAVVLAGAEGPRLRPMTANQPKAMLPVCNKPIMEHVLRLLKRHGFDQVIASVQFLGVLVRNYFGSGEGFGMSLQYATEEVSLGTAGSVKNLAGELRDEPFLVISGDTLTDIDLSAMVRAHTEKGALITVGLVRVPNPLEFGIVTVGKDGRIQRFLGEPTWGHVLSDTVNTGVYVMQPEVLAQVPSGEPVDWFKDVFPALLKRGAPLYGWIANGYWNDVSTHDSYMKAQVDVLSGRMDAEIDGFEMSPGVWVAEGAEVDPEALLSGPLCIGDYAKIEAGVHLGEYTVVGSNVVVKEGAFLQRAVVHNRVFVGQGVTLRGCVIGKSTDVMSRVRVEEDAVVGDECVIEPEAYLSAAVKVYPFKTIEAGAVVNTSVIWEARGQRTLFGPRGVSGLINVEVTPELCVRLCSAYATMLKKGSSVVVSGDAARATQSLRYAAIGALTAAAVNVLDLETCPLPVARFQTACSGSSGGIVLHTTPGDTQSVDIVFLDADGADLSRASTFTLERIFYRQEFRRAFPGEIASVSFPSRVFDTYARELMSRLSMHELEAPVKVVLDCSEGLAGIIMPSVLSKINADFITTNINPNMAQPTESRAQARAGMRGLSDLVISTGAAFGVRFDHSGERIDLVDEEGGMLSSERTMLLVVSLIAAKRRRGRVVLPISASRVAEVVCRRHGVAIEWTALTQSALVAGASEPDVILACDGRGGFIVPEVSLSIDGIAAFILILGLIASSAHKMSQVDAQIPATHLIRRSLPTPWAVKGAVLRAVIEAAGDLIVDTTDGVRIVEPSGGWVLVVPDPTDAVIHLWAEGADADATQTIIDKWTALVESVE